MGAVTTRSRRAGFVLGGVTAGVLAVSATAFACTPDVHNLNVVVKNTSSQRQGPAGTPVVASGFCYTTACAPNSSVSLRQDATPSVGRKDFVDHNALCRADDPVIGIVNFDASRAIVASTSGGTIAARAVPGPYNVCAGDNNTQTGLLWDTFTLS